MSFEDSLLLWFKAVKENYQGEQFPFVEIALEHKRHYEFADKHNISPKESDKDFYELRNSVWDSFKKFKNEENFVSYSEEIIEIKKAVEEKTLSLPKRIVLIDTEAYAPVEKDFIDFLSNHTEILKYEIDDSDIKLENEVSLFEDPQSEVEAAVNRAIELWEDGERSIGLAYFDESYKIRIEKVLSDFQNSFGDSFRYSIEDYSKVSEFVSFEVARKILCLSKEIAGDILADLASLPFFKPNANLDNEAFQTLWLKLKQNDKTAFEEFKNAFGFGEELNIFLEGRQKKISELVKPLKKIIKDHFAIQDSSPLSRSFDEIFDYLEFFEARIPEDEMFPYEFEKILTASIQNRKTAGMGSEMCGIQVLSYKNCAYQNFSKLFLIGANLSVLPNPIAIYPYLSAEEKKECRALDITEHFKKEEKFLKAVLATNKDVFISRAKKDKEMPFISSPLLKGEEKEKSWSKYDFSLNKFLLPESLIKSAEQELEGQFKEFEFPSLQMPAELKVTQEAMDIFKCPFLFFSNNYLKVKEPEEVSIFIDLKGFGSFLHALVARIGEKIKNITQEEGLNIDGIKQIAAELIEEKKEELTHLQRISLCAFLFGKGERKGFLDEFVEFEKTRIRDGWWIEALENECSKVLPQFDNITIKGRIDRIESSSDGPKKRVIDFKASAGKNLKADEIFQLEMYKAILKSEQQGAPEIIATISRLLNISEKTSSPKEETINKNLNRFEESFNSVKQGDFKPNPQDKNNVCEYCNYGLICHIETKEVNQNGEDQESTENE
ncbi:MAG: PD-(D/E)XK nuclease family protein [Acidobacteria bacterium]|nr:PD-(D/E)XK nuclease family protein [Acidobacteriota bacterium]